MFHDLLKNPYIHEPTIGHHRHQSPAHGTLGMVPLAVPLAMPRNGFSSGSWLQLRWTAATSLRASAAAFLASPLGTLLDTPGAWVMPCWFDQGINLV